MAADDETDEGVVAFALAVAWGRLGGWCSVLFLGCFSRCWWLVCKWTTHRCYQKLRHGACGMWQGSNFNNKEHSHTEGISIGQMLITWPVLCSFFFPQLAVVLFYFSCLLFFVFFFVLFCLQLATKWTGALVPCPGLFAADWGLQSIHLLLLPPAYQPLIENGGEGGGAYGRNKNTLWHHACHLCLVSTVDKVGYTTNAVITDDSKKY